VRRDVLHSLHRFFTILSFAFLLGIGLTVARIFGYAVPWNDSSNVPQGIVMAALNKRVALISGHAGFDSGAVCTSASGEVLLTEVAVNASVAELSAQRLRRAGATVYVLEEYDPELAGLEVDVLLSLHADSCIEASGYKAAVYSRSRLPVSENRLLTCIDHYYPQITGLNHHPNTITHDMTEYHAFKRIDPSTPAAILEMGFLGGDEAILTTGVDRVAQGVAESILCYLRDELPNATVEPDQESDATTPPAGTPDSN
jgi:N-acetylmuramoyl-L-alanine amidase